MYLRLTLMFVSLLLSVVIGLTLARGGGDRAAGGGGAAKQVLIGLSLDTLKEARWQADRDMFVAAAEKLGAKVKVLAANSNDVQQMKDVQSLISAGVQVLVIAPHDGAAMARAADEARANGIPVLSYDRLITGSDKIDLYLSFDNEKVGRMQAQFVVDALKERNPIRVVRIYGAPTDNNAKLFKAGQDAVLEPLIKAGKVVVVHEDWAVDWRPENAKRIANAAITKVGKEFDAILAANDGTAGGAIQALTEEGLAGKILVTGQDAELAALQRIATGTQAMTVYKPIRTLARTGAELAVALAAGRKPATTGSIDNGRIKVPAVFAEIHAVTAETIVPTVVKDGFHAYDAIYANIPAEKRPARPE